MTENAADLTLATPRTAAIWNLVFQYKNATDSETYFAAAEAAQNGIANLERDLTRLRTELHAIDELMARRPALNKTTRYDNIAHAITTAGQADKAESALQRLRAGIQAIAERIRPEGHQGIANELEELAK